MSWLTRAGRYVALCIPFGAQAHHSIVAHYDPGDIRALTGTLESLRWANPHIVWVFSVENEQGERESWRAEGGAVNTLVRNGISRDLFPLGGEVTIIGPVSRFGRTEMIAAQGVVAGNQYGLFPALADELEEQLPPESVLTLTSAAGYDISYAKAPDLFRVWTPVDFPATGILPQELPLTDQARERMRAYNVVEDDLAAQCVPAGMPSMLDQPYPIEFIDQGDRIVFRFEEWNGVRTIYMDDAAPEDEAGSIFGRSTGRWDADTLVIETRDIGYDYYNDAGAPLTPAAVVTERYTLSADGRRMDWTATTVDPTMFTAPVTLTGWAVWAPDIEIQEFHCVVD